MTKTLYLHTLCAALAFTPCVFGQGAVPSGAILIMASGSCPVGYTEVTALMGRTLFGTRAANGDVGTTGGSDSVTPAGTNGTPSFTGNAASLTHSGAAVADHSYTPAGANGTASFTPAGSNAWPAGVPTFSGNSGTVPAETVSWPAGVPTAANESAHTHSVTAAGTNATVAIVPLGTNAASATTGNCAGTNIAKGTGATDACKATAPNLTVAAQVFTGSSTTVGAETFTGSPVTSGAGSTHAHTLSWPAGVPTNGTVAFTPQGSVAWPAGVPAFSGQSGAVPAQTFTGTPATLTHGVTQPSAHSYTPGGSVSAPTFSGAEFDNRSAFVRVIFCQKD